MPAAKARNRMGRAICLGLIPSGHNRVAVGTSFTGKPRVVLVPRTNPGLWASTPLALETRIRGRAIGCARGWVWCRARGCARGWTRGWTRGWARGRTRGRTRGWASGRSPGWALASRIPTGFWPLAQGCRACEATLGHRPTPDPTATRLCLLPTSNVNLSPPIPRCARGVRLRRRGR